MRKPYEHISLTYFIREILTFQGITHYKRKMKERNFKILNFSLSEKKNKQKKQEKLEATMLCL